MQYDVNQGLLQVIIEGEEINAVVGEAAQINVGEAINYIRTGTEEIEQAVQDGLSLIRHQVDRAEYYANSSAESAELAYRYRSTFIFEQGIAADTWTITHNLNKYPSVTVVDSANNVIEPDVEYINENSVVVRFVGEMTGTAYLN